MILRGALLGLLLTLLNLPMLVIVPLCVTIGFIPWWMNTPGDEVSPYGKNEPAMVSLYVNWGHWIGDVQWLAFRNCLYGLGYYFTPNEFKTIADYSVYPMGAKTTWYGTLWWVGNYQQVDIQIWKFNFLAGWMCRPVVQDPKDNRVPPNSTMRPIFSIRLRK